jgi:hypothetical protein
MRRSAFDGSSVERFHWTISGFGLLPVLACLCSGCGTGDYEQKLRDRKVVTKFDDFLPAENLPDAKLSIRVPNGFNVLAKGGNIDAKRVEPGVLKTAWLKRTYEKLVKDGDNEKPCYYYVGTLEQISQDNLARQFRSELSAVKGNNIVDWADFQSETPDMREVKWRKLRLTAPMEFYCKDKAGKEQFETEPGVVEVYFHEEGGVIAVVIWKLPASIEGGLKLDELSKLVAGGVTIVK